MLRRRPAVTPQLPPLDPPGPFRADRGPWPERRSRRRGRPGRLRTGDSAARHAHGASLFHRRRPGLSRQGAWRAVDERRRALRPPGKTPLSAPGSAPGQPGGDPPLRASGLQVVRGNPGLLRGPPGRPALPEAAALQAGEPGAAGYSLGAPDHRIHLRARLPADGPPRPGRPRPGGHRRAADLAGSHHHLHDRRPWRLPPAGPGAGRPPPGAERHCLLQPERAVVSGFGAR